MKWLTDLLCNTRTDEKKAYMSEYKGLSDFLHNASNDEKIKVFTEAARRANEDQQKVFERAEAALSSR